MPNLLHKSSVPVMAQMKHSIHAVLKSSPTSPSVSLKVSRVLSVRCDESPNKFEKEKDPIYVLFHQDILHHQFQHLCLSFWNGLNPARRSAEGCIPLNLPVHDTAGAHWHRWKQQQQCSGQVSGHQAAEHSSQQSVSYDSAQIALETFSDFTGLECWICWAGGAEFPWADKSRNRKTQSTKECCYIAMYPCLPGQAAPFPTCTRKYHWQLNK